MTLTALEFVFVRGLFTWLIAVVAILVAGVFNVLINIKEKDFLQAALYVLTTVALCMGYFVILQ